MKLFSLGLAIVASVVPHGTGGAIDEAAVTRDSLGNLAIGALKQGGQDDLNNGSRQFTDDDFIRLHHFFSL